MNATLESWQKRKRRIKSITITAIKKWTVHTPLTTHLTAWFCQDPLFFGWVAVLLWLHLPVCVCVCLFAPCVQVYLRLTTTQYHSVWTLNGSPSSKATRLLCCFTQVSDRVFTTWHNRHNRQYNTTRVWMRSSTMKSSSEDSTLRPTTLGGAIMEDLLLRHSSTPSCSHACINPLEQGKLVHTPKVLFTPHGRTVGVFHCDNINDTLHSGKCQTGSEQLHFWAITGIWCPGVMVMGVDEGRGWICIVG